MAKLSGITNGGQVAPATDQLVAVRNGTSDVLVTPPTSLPPSGSAGGDLSGTYPNPTVNKINGITPGAANGAATLDANSKLTLAQLPSYPNTRPPSPLDDNTAGFSTSQFWLYNNQFWSSKDVTTKRAVWQRQNITGRPVDMVGSALGAYGVMKLVNGYAGNAFQITRASDSTTLDIPFVNNVADWNAADNFLAGTIGGVSKWYDQSGNANDLVQATQANMPQIYGNMVNGLRSITFDGQIAGVVRKLANTTMAVTNKNTHSAVFIGRLAQATYSSALYELGTTAAFSLYTQTGTSGASCGLVVNDGVVKTFTEAPINTPSVSLFVANGGPSTISINDKVASLSSSVSSASATGLLLGNTTRSSGFQGEFEALAFIIYNSALSAANQQVLLQACYYAGNVQPQIRDNWAFVGDSITRGQGPSTNDTANSYVGQLALLQKRPFNFYNFGHDSELAATMVGEATGYANLAYVPGVRNVATIFAGTNDLAANDSVSNVYGYIQALAAAWKAVGFKVAICTVLPRNGGFSNSQNAAGFETARQSLNALIVANYATFADALIDVGGDSVIGVSSATSNTALYSADQVHPIGLGYSYVAADFQASTTLHALIA